MDDRAPSEGRALDPPLTIFINYRRSDSAGYARALFDRLAVRFEPDNVFFDAVTLQPGSNWLEDIRAHGSTCGAFLALIGPAWLTTLRERGASPDEDHVRSEIEMALRHGTGADTVIPVLIADAEMPSEHDVPGSIKPLLRRQKFELRPGQWDADVAALIEVLERITPQRRDDAVAAPPPPAPVPVETSTAPSPDAAHYEEVVRLMLDEGVVVPFLGPAANSSDRDGPWSESESGQLPDAQELALHLAQHLGVDSLPPDLAQIAQQMAVERGSGDLYRVLRRTLMQRSPPSSSELFLARLPATMRQAGVLPRYQLIVTTNYDDALERAFDDADEQYDLAVYMASGKDKGKFVHLPLDGEPTAVEVANSYGGFPIDPWGEVTRTVILKIHGGVDYARGPYAWRNNYVITEDDYIDYLSHVPVNNIVPHQLLGKLLDSHLLFLGYTMRDWSLRVFVQRIFGQRLPNSSWAIQRTPDRLDDRFWRRFGVDLFDAPIAEYVTDLAETVRASRATAR
jgi:hypothetical protein